MTHAVSPLAARSGPARSGARLLGRPAAAAAAGAATIYLGFAGMQLALAAGAPLGEHVWGGSQERVLPVNMRVVAGSAAALLAGMAFVVTRRAGLVGSVARWVGPATWVTASYMALNTVGNLASSSRIERLVFGSATAVAAGLTAFVAIAGRR